MLYSYRLTGETERDIGSERERERKRKQRKRNREREREEEGREERPLTKLHGHKYTNLRGGPGTGQPELPPRAPWKQC